jgi:hypothetical protein
MVVINLPGNWKINYELQLNLLFYDLNEKK